GVNLVNADFTVRGSGTLNVNAPITGTGDLLKRGSGTLWLNADSTFDGGIDIREGGTLHLASGASAGAAGHDTFVRESTLKLHPGSTLTSDTVVLDRFATLNAAGT